MAFISVDLSLPGAFRKLPVQLYFPTDLPEGAGGGGQVNGVITLLHGLAGSGSDWMHMTAACRYAADNGYILIAPNAENSFYNDMAYGAPFYTIITELMPAELDKIFKIPRAREMNYIAGLSMGGYGALRIGLAHPERYAAIGDFSGAVDMQGRLALDNPLDAALVTSILGNTKTLPHDADVFALAEDVARLPATGQPRILITCGSRDTGTLGNNLLEQNQRLASHAQKLGLNSKYLQWDGVHEWNFWDRSLAEFIGFIQNSDYGERKKQDWKNPYEQ